MRHTFICLFLAVLLMIDVPFLLVDPLEDRIGDVYVPTILFQARKTSISTLNIILGQELSVQSVHLVVYTVHKVLCHWHHVSIT